MVCDNTEKLDAHLKTHYDEAGMMRFTKRSDDDISINVLVLSFKCIFIGLSPVSPIISSDDFIAKEMQKGYKESLKQIEKRDFQHLQVMISVYIFNVMYIS